MKVVFNNKKSPFFRSLKQKVDSYFEQKNLEPSGGARLYAKGAFQLLSALALYVILVFFTPGTLVAILLCCLLGINFAAIGFNIMHEGGHGSFSRYGWLNSVSSYSLNILGGNAHYWKVKHNINHHTFTNIEGLDSDIDVKPFMRLHEDQPLLKMHKYQHWYWVILYGVSYMVWVFYHDFQKYVTGKIAEGHEDRKTSLKEHLIFWVTKVFYVLIYIALPIYLLGLGKALIGYAIVSFVCGLFISVVFQLAHMVEDTEFPVPDTASNKIEQEWAIHQINTTANFATKDKFVSWLLGGLNFQIEHHLFPRVSHIHYPAISAFVKETCQEFNVTYNEFPTMFSAFRSHLQHLKNLGQEYVVPQEPELAPVHPG